MELYSHGGEMLMSGTMQLFILLNHFICHVASPIGEGGS